jgi:PAS domain S-box-containing protein
MIGDHVGEYCYSAYEKKSKICKGCPLFITFKDGGIHMAVRSALTERGVSYFEITSSPIKVPTGEIIAGIEIARDVTERKKTEEALRESEREYRNLAENSLVGIYKTNIKGDILYINKALADIFEFESVEDMKSIGVISLYKNPDDRKLLIETLKEGKAVRAFEIEVLTKKRKTKHVLLSALLDKDIVSGMIMDITEHKKVEVELKQRVEELEKFYQIAIDREIRMAEQKAEINKLREELSQYKK